MTEKIVTITNRAGLHARPAAVLVQASKDFKCHIYFEKDNDSGEKDRINAKSIMGILTLGAAYGTKVTIIADGEDEQYAVDTIVHLFESKFEEE
jgi:phosphocarrier protein